MTKRNLSIRLRRWHEEIRLKLYELQAAETRSQRRSISKDVQNLELKLRKLELKEAEHLSRKDLEKTQ